MQTSVTPLTARTQAMFTALLVTLTVMGASPFMEIIASRWPFRFSEVFWRYDTVAMLLATGPQTLVLIAVILAVALLTGNRGAVRAGAIVLGFFAVASVIFIPLFALDFLQAKRFVAVARLSSFKLVALKTIGFAILVLGSALWVALRAWQASERDGVGLRRQKGEGLVVGQPKAPKAGE